MNQFEDLNPSAMQDTPQDSREAPSTPYLSARRHWNHHTGGLMASQRMWQAVALSSSLVSTLSLGAAIYFANRGEYIPYIVEVDTLGQVRFAGAVPPIEQLETKIVQFLVRDFIYHARMVTIDKRLQEQAIRSVYAKLERNSAALGKIETFMAEGLKSYKRLIAGETPMQSVNVNVLAVLQTGAASWQVEWKEHHYNAKGRATATTFMQATLIIQPKLITNRTHRDLALNPLDAVIQDFFWETKEG